VDFQKVAIADWGGYPNLNGTAEQSLDLSGFNLEGALLGGRQILQLFFGIGCLWRMLIFPMPT